MERSGGLTYADLEAMFPEQDLVRRELIDGELFVSPSPITRHQAVVGRLYIALARDVEGHGGATVFIGPLDVLFSDRNVVEPDLVVIPDAQSGIVTEKNIQGVPALLIEVLSQPRMDRVRKRDLYARFGVPEYWIVDPDADRVEVYRLHGDGYGKPEILEPGDALTFEALPNLRIDVGVLLAR